MPCLLWDDLYSDTTTGVVPLIRSMVWTVNFMHDAHGIRNQRVSHPSH